MELIEGKGACPPEDSNGIEKCACAWADFLHEYKANPNTKKMKNCVKVIETTASDYTHDWLTGRSVPCRPLEYDIARHRLLLRTMLSGGYLCTYICFFIPTLLRIRLCCIVLICKACIHTATYIHSYMHTYTHTNTHTLYRSTSDQA